MKCFTWTCPTPPRVCELWAVVLGSCPLRVRISPLPSKWCDHAECMAWLSMRLRLRPIMTRGNFSARARLSYLISLIIARRRQMFLAQRQRSARTPFVTWLAGQPSVQISWEPYSCSTRFAPMRPTLFRSRTQRLRYRAQGALRCCLWSFRCDAGASFGNHPRRRPEVGKDPRCESSSVISHLNDTSLRGRRAALRA